MTKEEKNRQDPEVAFFFERPELTRKFIGLSYADGTQYEKLDIYLPESGDGPFPVIIDVHGGGWFYGSRSSQRMDPVLQGLHRGYAVVSIDYTLSRYAKFPLQVQELKAAVRFLRKHAKEYCLNTDKMAMWGLSAGAHLSMLAAFTGDSGQLDDADLSDVNISCALQALVALYGPTDLTLSGDCDADSMETVILGGIPNEIPETAKLANPCTYVNAQMPPCFLQYGDADELVTLAHGMALKEKLDNVRAGADYFEIVHGAKHADKLFRTPENTEKIFAFLDKYLKA